MGVSDEIHVPVALVRKRIRPSSLDTRMSEMDEVKKVKYLTGVEPW
jgi:hypothetical protein